jgi:predicted transcriptional regulator
VVYFSEHKIEGKKGGNIMIRMNITISDDLAERLGVMSEQSDSTKSEIFRKALTLFELAQEGKRHGKKLALVGNKGEVVTEIVGL